jgi:hypothetical protein
LSQTIKFIIATEIVIEIAIAIEIAIFAQNLLLHMKSP